MAAELSSAAIEAKSGMPPEAGSSAGEAATGSLGAAGGVETGVAGAGSGATGGVAGAGFGIGVLAFGSIVIIIVTKI